MNNRFIEGVGIGSSVALVTALINQVFEGKLNYWWVIGGFVGAIVVYTLYQNSGYPFITYRVTNKNDGKGLLIHDKADIVTGKPVGDAWQFRANNDAGFHPIYGPYIRKALRRGKYRAIFRIKVDDDISGPDTHITKIDVVSNFREHKGLKELASRFLMSQDFKDSGEYQDFHLDFEVFTDEREIELRVYPTAGYLVTLDSVRLSRRLF